MKVKAQGACSPETDPHSLHLGHGHPGLPPHRHLTATSPPARRSSFSKTQGSSRCGQFIRATGAGRPGGQTTGMNTLRAPMDAADHTQEQRAKVSREKEVLRQWVGDVGIHHSVIETKTVLVGSSGDWMRPAEESRGLRTTEQKPPKLNMRKASFSQSERNRTGEPRPRAHHRRATRASRGQQREREGETSDSRASESAPFVSDPNRRHTEPPGRRAGETPEHRTQARRARAAPHQS